MFTLRQYFETEDTAQFIYRTMLLQERETQGYEKAKNEIQLEFVQGNARLTESAGSSTGERVSFPFNPVKG
jgi:hypothetical protein